MLTVELPRGQRLDFETREALAQAVKHVRSGSPVVVRDERDGTKQIVWAPEDADWLAGVSGAVHVSAAIGGTPFPIAGPGASPGDEPKPLGPD